MQSDRSGHHGLAEVADHVIELGNIKPTLYSGLRLLLETVIVPTLLLYACMVTVGGFVGLIAVLAWCALTVAVRMATVRRIPGTLLLAIAMLVGRTSIALALSSVYVYLLQPVAGSMFMAVLFIGSALIGRPITMRLAQDFVNLPGRLVSDRRVHKMFVQVSLLWGVSRLLDAGMSLGVLHFGLAAGIFSRGVFSGLLTALSIGVCSYWGWSRLRRIDGVRFHFGAPAAAPAA
ncbi:VC0807 family protein [Nocardioides terrisoli]|uniref:VC0807 family protein n=1 Tax=Nocardioides terrisoli TaxID=3388267 RepID=UPI00287BADD3|nr:VC0807 family protein [Nocardioides marmorisolisilvae]